MTGFIVMTLLGLPLALPVAILSFFGGFIPYIGQFVTSLIAFLVAVAFGTTQDVIVMGIWTAVFNVVQGSVIAPLVYGRAVSLHPAIVLIVIPAGGALAGVLGMFLAVPLVGIIGAVWRHVLAAIGEVPPPVSRRPIEQANAPPIAIPAPEPPPGNAIAHRRRRCHRSLGYPSRRPSRCPAGRGHGLDFGWHLSDGIRGLLSRGGTCP